MQANLCTSLPLPTLDAQRPIMCQRSSHTAPDILGSTLVQLLKGVFQQPAERVSPRHAGSENRGQGRHFTL
jgi:hypothetical protein